MEELVSILKRLDKALDAGHQEMLDNCYTGCHQKSLDYIYFFKKILGCFEKEILAQGLFMRAKSAIKIYLSSLRAYNRQGLLQCQLKSFETD